MLAVSKASTQRIIRCARVSLLIDNQLYVATLLSHYHNRYISLYESFNCDALKLYYYLCDHMFSVAKMVFE